MEKIFLLAIAISTLFLLAKIVEMRYFDKQKPLKMVIRDTVIVLGCAFLPLLVFFQFDVKFNEIFQFGEAPTGPSQIFTDDPGF
mgnify:CR=1 FL=1